VNKDYHLAAGISRTLWQSLYIKCSGSVTDTWIWRKFTKSDL